MRIVPCGVEVSAEYTAENFRTVKNGRRTPHPVLRNRILFKSANGETFLGPPGPWGGPCRGKVR